MKTKTYEDFDLSIEKAGDRYRARVLNSPDGPAPATEFEMPFSDLELENFVLRFGQTRRTMRNIGVAGETTNRSLREFGTRLYSAIFSGPISDCLQASLGVVGQKQDAGLRIRLRLTDAPDLIDIPWEYLFDASSGRFLTLSVDTPVVRYLDLRGQVRPLAVQPPLRILVMVSSPAGYAELDVEQEWQKLRDAVADLERRGVVVLERMEKATLSELQRRVRREEVHVFHFIGHGGFDEAAQDGVLILEAEDGKARPTSGKYLGTLLHDEKSVQLAFLNACEGGRTSRQDPFAGVGQSLVQQGIPAVVAMQFEISDQAATTLAHEFYAALADNYPVDAALAEARKAIFAQDNPLEWGTPVLYMRTEDGKIFDVAPVETALTPTGATAPPPTKAEAADASPAMPGSASVLPPVTPDKVSQHTATDGPAARQRLAEAPVSIGVRVASWSALAGLIAFFLPYGFVFSWHRASGAVLATGGSFMPELLVVILGPAIVLGLRLTLAGREGSRLGIPLILLGLLPLFVLNAVLADTRNPLYGILVSVVAFVGILVGGMADLILPEDRKGATPLRLAPGHITALVGAGLAVLGALVAIRIGYDKYRSPFAVGLLLASGVLVWLWVLLASRRGRTIWLDSVGNVLAALVCATGWAINSQDYGGDMLAVLTMLGASVAMLVGGATNFVLAVRQQEAKVSHYVTPAGQRIAMLGLVFLLPLLIVGFMGSRFGWLLFLSIPIVGVPALVLRARKRQDMDVVGSRGLLALGLFAIAVCLVAGLVAATDYRIDEVLLGIIAPGVAGGALMIWGGLLNRRAAQDSQSAQGQRP